MWDILIKLISKSFYKDEEYHNWLEPCHGLVVVGFILDCAFGVFIF